VDWLFDVPTRAGLALVQIDGDEDLDKGGSELEEVEPGPDAALSVQRVFRWYLLAVYQQWQLHHRARYY